MVNCTYLSSAFRCSVLIWVGRTLITVTVRLTHLHKVHKHGIECRPFKEEALQTYTKITESKCYSTGTYSARLTIILHFA